MNTAFWNGLAVTVVLADWFVPIAIVVVFGSIIGMVVRSSRSKSEKMVSDPPTALEKVPVVLPIPSVSNSSMLSGETLAMIAAVVRVTLGATARVAQVTPAQTPPVPVVEIPSPHWSMEGRRQIYSSHQIR